nr:hypothetical protein [Tanacetum cinerariifolium]
ADQAPSAEETEPFKTDESTATPPPHPAYPPPPGPIRSLGYRAAMIRLRDETASTTSPPLQLPSSSRREDRPEVTLPPRKRLDIAFGPRYEVGESSSAAAARPAGGLRAMIDQRVTTALAARDALRSTNGDDSHNSGTGVRRT